MVYTLPYPKPLSVILRKTNMVSFLKVFRSIRKIITGSPKLRTSWRLKSVQLKSTSEQNISTWTCGSGSYYWCWRHLWDSWCSSRRVKIWDFHAKAQRRNLYRAKAQRRREKLSFRVNNFQTHVQCTCTVRNRTWRNVIHPGLSIRTYIMQGDASWSFSIKLSIHHRNSFR